VNGDNKICKNVGYCREVLKIDFMHKEVHNQDNGNALITVFRKTVFLSERSIVNLYCTKNIMFKILMKGNVVLHGIIMGR
jgi:hypothetical protein